jgi:hypothetical protein
LLHVFFISGNITGKIKLRVIDAKGSALTELNKTFLQGEKADINISPFAHGQYYLIIEQNGRIIYQKRFQKD